MKDLFSKLATVCRSAAEELERAPVAEKTAAEAPAPEAEATPTPVSKFASAFEEMTGEALPATVAEKLAADESLVDVVQKVAAAKAPRRALGHAHETRPAQQGSTKEAQTRDAYDRFQDWLLGNS